jgi:hypothetical protein
LCHFLPALLWYRTTYTNGNDDSSDHAHGNDDTGEDREHDQSDVDMTNNNDDKTPDINDAALPLYVYAFFYLNIIVVNSFYIIPKLF